MSETLVSAGAPAVLGWALSVGDGSANILASRLYSYLATGERLDESVAKARQQLFENKSPYWHLLRLYSDATPLKEIVTHTQTPGRLPLRGRQANEDFLDAWGKKKVASREAFVGRRRQIQRCLRVISIYRIYCLTSTRSSVKRNGVIAYTSSGRAGFKLNPLMVSPSATLRTGLSNHGLVVSSSKN